MKKQIKYDYLIQIYSNYQGYTYSDRLKKLYMKEKIFGLVHGTNIYSSQHVLFFS